MAPHLTKKNLVVHKFKHCSGTIVILIKKQSAFACARKLSKTRFHSYKSRQALHGCLLINMKQIGGRRHVTRRQRTAFPAAVFHSGERNAKTQKKSAFNLRTTHLSWRLGCAQVLFRQNKARSVVSCAWCGVYLATNTHDLTRKFISTNYCSPFRSGAGDSLLICTEILQHLLLKETKDLTHVNSGFKLTHF